MDDFYDRLAPLYDMIFLDWDAGMEQQAGRLAGIIADRWGADVRTILDVACGIGTQSIGLARKGFSVTASDLSAGAVERAKDEARRRGVEIDFSVCDMRVAHAHHGREFDMVIACDNAIPHLLSDDEILMAFRQMLDCTRPGGGCLVTVAGLRPGGAWHGAGQAVRRAGSGREAVRDLPGLGLCGGHQRPVDVLRGR